MILSDNEIKQLCTPPNYFVEEMLHPIQLCNGTYVNNDAFILPCKNTRYTYESKETLDKKLIKKQSFLQSDVGIISYRELTQEEKDNFKPMISPFIPNQVREVNGGRIISYGVSSYGYDLRCGYKFKIFSNINSTVADPKNFDPKSFVDVEVEKPGDFIIIPPNSFILTHALELMNIPKNVTGIVIGKSTYARVGVNCLCTPAESGWSGYLTLEFSNTTPLPVKFYAGEGCCQICFFEGRVDPLVSYADRSGKYQNQGREIVLPRV